MTATPSRLIDKYPDGTARVSERKGSPQFTAPTSPRRKVFEALGRQPFENLKFSRCARGASRAKEMSKMGLVAPTTTSVSRANNRNVYSTYDASGNVTLFRRYLPEL
jgi:hypothetical protein